MKELVLVTGGTGYIGSHTVIELIEEGYNVLIADNLSNSRIEVLDGIEEITGVRPEFEKADLADIMTVNKLFDAYPDIKAIIHFAAYKAVGESVEFPLKYYYNNINSLINLLENMVRLEIPSKFLKRYCRIHLMFMIT